MIYAFLCGYVDVSLDALDISSWSQDLDALLRFGDTCVSHCKQTTERYSFLFSLFYRVIDGCFRALVFDNSFH